MRSKTDKRQIEYVSLGALTPYARNSRTHSPEQVKRIAASIREFGFTNPVLVDGEGTIIAGHGRVLAAEHLQMETVPVVKLEYMTEQQKRAYVIADNKLALDAGWDEELLRVELEALHADGYAVELTGFGAEELSEIMLDSDEDAEQYTRKIETPVYEPKGERYTARELYDTGKTEELLKGIEEAELDEEVRAMLVHAAQRHTVFNFRKAAEYFAQATPEVQQLMIASAMVIVDWKSAIEHGFVKINSELDAAYNGDYDGDEA